MAVVCDKKAPCTKDYLCFNHAMEDENDEEETE